jgi:hypothetical protein
MSKLTEIADALGWSPPSILADPHGLDQLIEWKMGSIDSLRKTRLNTIARGAQMQRQFTIELRVDFVDTEKLGPLKQVLQQAARHAFATAMLISDNPKSTRVAIFSDDFFTGHQEIALLEDVIQQGLDATGETTSGSESISSELMAAVQSPKDEG